LEPEFRQEATTVLSDDAKDALRDCLAQNEGLAMRAADIRGLARKVLHWDRSCYWLTFSTALVSLAGLATWFFYEGMPDGLARLAIIAPISLAFCALMTAAGRQIHMHRANDALTKEDT